MRSKVSGSERCAQRKSGNERSKVQAREGEDKDDQCGANDEKLRSVPRTGSIGVYWGVIVVIIGRFEALIILGYVIRFLFAT
jgi:hypothetical protein